ncbi:MAG: HlyD family efflux transporter periplasmic adaptor subunit [Telmatospirillum sp.]|nr:HlyD family efflux transporter periplasmic adaptor subunit [Telmatospirillum sp.]
MKRAIPMILIPTLAALAGGYWWQSQRAEKPADFALYGNIDLRQVSLAFNGDARIVTLSVQEGDHVHPGQVLGNLDADRLTHQLAEATAQLEAQRQLVLRAHNGSRPEEIAQARASVAASEADAAYARNQLDRLQKVASTSSGEAVSRQDLDNAKSALDAANARLENARKALELAVLGPRKEDVAQAEALQKAAEAKVAYLRRLLADTTLIAPANAVVRNRLLEPGDMASPEKPVYSLAIVDPKWVRAFVSETDLGRLRPGMAAKVSADSFPGRQFDGWIGFISPVAEFTPKSVQTEELRPSLAYEVRVFVKDQNDELRLGMPATVRLVPAGGDQQHPASSS